MLSKRILGNIMCASSGPSGVFTVNCFTEHREWVPELLFPILAIVSWFFLLTSSSLWLYEILKDKDNAPISR